MADFEFTGMLTHIVDKSGTNKAGEAYEAFDYRIEETEGQYPASILVGSYNKDFGKVEIGNIVKCSYNPRTNIMPDGRIFGNNNVWRLEAVTPAAGGPPAGDTPPPPPTPTPTPTPTPAEVVSPAEDGLPF